MNDNLVLNLNLSNKRKTINVNGYPIQMKIGEFKIYLPQSVYPIIEYIDNTTKSL